MNDETISEQQETSDEQATQEDSPQSLETSTNVVDGTEIPTKFVGKSLDEVVSAYKEVESYAGKVASEKAESDQKAAALEERIQEMEAQFARQTEQRQPVVQEQQVDPYASYEEDFDDNPKKAIRDALEAQDVRRQQESQQHKQKRQAIEAEDYITQARKENPDFVRREKLMSSLINEYKDLFNDNANSAKGMKLLELASKGADLSYYEKQAGERSRKDGLSARDEKRAAQSESAGSEGEQVSKFTDLSRAEMAKLLGRSDD